MSIKVLMLGGSGILSSAVSLEAVNREYEVTCLTTGRHDVLLPKGIKLIHGNANDPKTFIDYLDSHYDTIIDFLSYNTIQLKAKLQNLLSYTNQYVFISSATAYKLIEDEITEETPLGNQFWDYAENKIACEKLLKAECDNKSVKYTIVRPYITYGNTRLPFGIIPNEYWSLANRILCNKPVLLWDDGQAICTLTHTSDFAKGVVSLFANENAYNEAFHVTSDERLSWKEVLSLTSKALGKNESVYSAKTNDILDYLPEYTGILTGDKGRNRIFNNSKISSIEPEFRNFKRFEDGIKETVEFYKNNDFMRIIDYVWDGRIDATIIKLAKSQNQKIDKSVLKFRSSERKKHFKDFIKYCVGRYDFLYFLYSVRKAPNKKAYIKKYFSKKDNLKAFRDRFHHYGYQIKIGNCSFGNDLEMISLGNNIQINDGTNFITYRPTAEFFDKVVGNGINKELRDLGKIDIKDNVYIGSNVIIYPNVTIGSGSCILDGSVVYDSVPSNSLVGGNPAKVIGNMNDWYNNILNINSNYPWIGKGYNHDKIVIEREKYLFGKQQ